ncbi:MAG: hypothetical protein CW338_12375, partial [Clostridiales bacterium]|nr:hypothetical protein [Clostridiales bacterium]
EQGFTCVPIIFNGNGIDPSILEEDFYEFGDRYCRDVVCALKDEPGLLMYDVMNEPPCNDLILKAGSQEEKDEQYARIWRFVRHYCAVVKEADSENAMTVGNWLAEDLENTADLVDVLSYHDYSATASGINRKAHMEYSVSAKYEKSVINNEC